MAGIVVLVSGNGSNLQAIAEACCKNQINSNIINVISNNPNAFGIVRAKRLNIPYICIDHKDFSTRDDFDLSLMRHIEQFDPDLIVLAGFMRILTKTFTRCFNGKLINIHPSILPKYPGLNTHEKVLLSEDKHHGVTIHYVNEVVDAGAIIAQGILRLPDSPNERKMIDNIHRIEHDLYPRVVSEIIDHKIKYKNEYVKFTKDSIFYENNVINYEWK